MFDKFTDRARKVFQLANKEALRFNHEYVGDEHILLGLVRGDVGVAIGVLKMFDIDPRKIRLEVEKIVQSGPDMVTAGKLPQTPRAKKVIEYSMEEAHNLNHNHVGTEHILLGLLREQEGVAALVLTDLGLTLEKVRAMVLIFLGPDVQEMGRTESKTILDEAAELTSGPRQADYGHPIEDHTRTATMWSALLGVEVTAEQVCLCMVALKMSRECNKTKRDNLTDGCGYFRNIEQIQEVRAKELEQRRHMEEKVRRFKEKLESCGTGGDERVE